MKPPEFFLKCEKYISSLKLKWNIQKRMKVNFLRFWKLLKEVSKKVVASFVVGNGNILSWVLLYAANNNIAIGAIFMMQLEDTCIWSTPTLCSKLSSRKNMSMISFCQYHKHPNVLKPWIDWKYGRLIVACRINWLRYIAKCAACKL